MNINGEYTQQETAIILEKVLNKVCKIHNSSPNTTGLRHYPTGCYSVDINGSATYWFFDEFELARWMMELLKDD
jgi:hypothetical protein